MSENSPAGIFLFLLALLGWVFLLLYFLGVRLLSVGEIAISVQFLAGAFIGATLSITSISEYRKGQPRTALGIALLGIGVLLVWFDTTSVFAELSVLFVLASVGVMAEIDRRILSLTA